MTQYFTENDSILNYFFLDLKIILYNKFHGPRENVAGAHKIQFRNVSRRTNTEGFESSVYFD